MSLRQHRDALCSVLPVAAVGITGPARDRKPKPRQAVDFCRDNGEIYEVGEEWSDRGACNLKICRAGGIVEVTRCPFPDVPNGCMLGEPDLAQTFPLCCPKAECSRSRRGSSSSSSSSSTSSSEAGDKYEDLDDDDCGDDGDDMTMDFTAMEVEQEDSKYKETRSKTTERSVTNDDGLTNRKRQNENVKPPDIKSDMTNKNYRAGKCSERRVIREHSHSINEGRVPKDLTSISSVRQSDPRENLKILVRDKESPAVAAEIIKDKSVAVKTDFCPEKNNTHKNTAETLTVNNADLTKIKQQDKDIKLSDSNRMGHGTEKSHHFAKLSEPEENLKILVRDKEIPVVAVETVKDKSVAVKTDIHPVERIGTHKKSEETLTVNKANFTNIKQQDKEIKLLDSNHMGHGPEKCHHDGKCLENSPIHDVNSAKEITLPENGIIIYSAKQTETKENQTILAESQENPQLVIEISKFENKPDIGPDEKTFPTKSTEESLPTNPVQEIGKFEGVKHSVNTENMHFSEGIVVKAQDLKITEIKANSQLVEEEIFKDKTLDKSDDVGVKNSNIYSEENCNEWKATAKTLDITDKHSLEGVASGENQSLRCTENSYKDIKESDITVTEVTAKLTPGSSRNSFEYNKECDANVRGYGTINVLKESRDLLTDSAHGLSAENAETSVQFSDTNNKIVGDEKIRNDSEENENPSIEKLHVRDLEGADKMLLFSDNSNGVLESKNPTDKVTEFPKSTYEISSEKYSSESVKEFKSDMNQFEEDEGANLKEAINDYHRLKETFKEVLDQEGKVDCWEGIEKRQHIATKDEEDKLIQELGPDKEFEKEVESVIKTHKYAMELQEYGETNCSEGLDEYYKHVDLRKEDEQFKLEPAEDIEPLINNLKAVSEFGESIERKRDLNDYSFNEEFAKYRATVADDSNTNPFARFEIHPDHDKSHPPEERTEDGNKMIEESHDAVTNDNDQHGYSLDVNTETTPPQDTEEVYCMEDHTDVIDNDVHAETIPENTNDISLSNEEHLHTTVDISDDVLGYNQVLESGSATGETEFNFNAQEDMITHSVDESQESNPLGVTSDGQMSGSADTDRFAPSIEAEEEDGTHDHDQFTTEAHT